MSFQTTRLSVLISLIMLTACENQPNPPTSAPTEGRKSFKDAIREEAGKVADAAREGAANVAQSAKEVAHVAKEEALLIAAAARELARTTKEQSVTIAQQKFDEARAQLAVLKEQKEHIQESLRPEYDRAVAELSERLNDLQSRVGQLREAAPEAWRKSVEDMAPLVADLRTRFDSAWDAYVHGGRLRGSVTYLERVLLPDNAELRVRLLDVSKSDSNAATVAQFSSRVQGAPPFAFDLRFDPAKVNPKGAYAIDAEILIDTKRHFATLESKRIAIGDGAATVEVLVKRAE